MRSSVCVCVCVRQGLGGMTGAALAGSGELVAEARVWLRRFGGNLYTQAPYAVSALAALDGEHDQPSFAARAALTREFTQAVKRAAERAAAAGGGARVAIKREDLVLFSPDPPECCLVHCHLRGGAEELDKARDESARKTGYRVYRKLRGESYLANLPAGPDSSSRTSSSSSSSSSSKEKRKKDWQYFEWNVGPVNGAVPVGRVEEAWAAFFKCLHEDQNGGSR